MESMNSPEVVKLYDKLNKKEKLSDYDLLKVYHTKRDGVEMTSWTRLKI